MFIKIQGVYVNRYVLGSYSTAEEYKTGPDGSEVLVYCVYYQTTGGRPLKDEFTDKVEFDERVKLLGGGGDAPIPTTPMLVQVYNDEVLTDLAETIGCNTNAEIRTACIGKKYVKITGVAEAGSLSFSNISSLLTLDLSGLDTSNVTVMSNTFNECRNLKSLNLSNFNTSNVTYMGGMFSFCSSLTTLDVTDFNTIKVHNISQMFRNCALLKTLDVSNFDTRYVTSTLQMFAYADNLSLINMYGFSSSRLTQYSNMFLSVTATIITNQSFATFLKDTVGYTGEIIVASSYEEAQELMKQYSSNLE